MPDTREDEDVDFRDYLKEKCRQRNISLHRLALLCDLNQIYFYQAVNKAFPHFTAGSPAS